MEENIQIVETASLAEAEKKAREILQNQIEELKSDAAKQMVGHFLNLLIITLFSGKPRTRYL